MVDPTKRFTTLNDFRMRFLRLYYGATDETSDDSVPADRRDDFRDHVQYHREAEEQIFEKLCERFGATDGTWRTVPESRRVEALQRCGRRIAKHLNRCEFELDLLKIDQEQERDIDFG